MIGIFDSGLGGLTVARAIMRKMPDCPIIYFGDTARTPYGNKSKAMIEQYAIEDTKFLIEKGAQVIVIACNTASALACDVIKKTFPWLPVFEVIAPAAQAAAQATQSGRVGVIGTRATIGSKVYEKKLKAANRKLQVFSQACPLLVPLIEEDWGGEPETRMILREYVASIKKADIDTLILGCTHYPLIRNLIQRTVGEKVKLIDSSEIIAKDIKNHLDSLPDCQPNQKQTLLKVFVSDLTPHFQKLAEQWLKKKIKIELAKI